MAILATFEKQPNDVQDYDVSFADWLYAQSDTGFSKSVTADSGITVSSSSLLSDTTSSGISVTNGKIKVWLSGGVSGTSYKITLTMTTTGGRTKEAEIKIKVKDT